MRADLSPNGKRIWLTFPYDHWTVQVVKRLPGAQFVPKDKGGPAWSFPLNFKSARDLRMNLGSQVRFSRSLNAWGKDEKRRTAELQTLSVADDADLPGLLEHHQVLEEYLRPYQRADVALMARSNLLNANEMGTGKTVEVIAAAYEAGRGGGCHLIIAPVQSLEQVWAREIVSWIGDDEPVLTDSDREARKDMIDVARYRYEQGESFWLIINPEMVRYERDKKNPKKKWLKNPKLYEIEWDTITIDEYHKTGLADPKSLTSKAINKLQSHHRWALSGTPDGGRALNLYGALHWLDPIRFPSQWHWAKQWLDVVSNGFGHDIGEIKKGTEDEFYLHHAPYILRRKKLEVMPWLPEKVYTEVHCEMTTKQRKQYEKFALDAEIKINGTRLTGTSILAEYAYLKMFANALCEVKDDKVIPTEESDKLEKLLMNLQYHGVDSRGGEFSIVGTQSARFARVIAKYLEKAKIQVGLITAETKAKDRNQIIDGFNTGDSPRVIVMVTTAGTSLNLQRADSVHILDRTWNPDNELQLEDRGDRGSRTTGLCVYYYTMMGTIEEQINGVTSVKRITSKNILDVIRSEWK